MNEWIIHNRINKMHLEMFITSWLSECKQIENIEPVQSNIPAFLLLLTYESINNIDEKR